MATLIQNIRTMLRDTRGAALIEFVMFAPIVAVLAYGATEISRYILLQQKLERMSYTVNDMVTMAEGAQQGTDPTPLTLTLTRLNQILGTRENQFSPFNFGSNAGGVIVTSIHQEPGEAPRIVWQHAVGATNTGESTLGSGIDTPITLPTGAPMFDDENMIVVETMYTYQPLFDRFSQLSDPKRLHKTTFFRPRDTNGLLYLPGLVNPPCSTPPCTYASSPSPGPTTPTTTPPTTSPPTTSPPTTTPPTTSPPTTSPPTTSPPTTSPPTTTPSFGGGGGGCFAGDTAVLMADGSTRQIKDIKQGDYVMAFDMKDPRGALTSRKVAATVRYDNRDTLRLNHTIVVTPDHKLPNAKGMKVTAGSLQVGDSLIGADGKPVAITSIERNYATLPVYNMEVEGLHTYVVHNVRSNNQLIRQSSIDKLIEEQELMGVSISISGGGGPMHKH